MWQGHAKWRLTPLGTSIFNKRHTPVFPIRSRQKYPRLTEPTLSYYLRPPHQTGYWDLQGWRRRLEHLDEERNAALTEACKDAEATLPVKYGNRRGKLGLGGGARQSGSQRFRMKDTSGRNSG